MNLHNDIFTLRQNMKKSDFECYYYKNDAPLTIPFHQHEFFEVFFFLSGNVSYVIEGKMYQLRAGDILLTNNLDIHKPIVKSGKKYERYVLWINPKFLTELNKLDCNLTSCFHDSSEKKYKLIRPDVTTLSNLKHIFEKMLKNRDNREMGSNILLNAYLMEFLVYLNRAYFATPDSICHDITENKKINQIVSYVNTHYQEELSLDIICENFYISKSHLTYLFKAYTGLTLYQFIIKKRLTVAKNMLIQNKPVMQTCIDCGFTDYSNFLKAFKREFGLNPKEISKQAK